MVQLALFLQQLMVEHPAFSWTHARPLSEEAA